MPKTSVSSQKSAIFVVHDGFYPYFCSALLHNH